MQTLQDFASQFKVHAIARRHFDYDNPMPNKDASLVYTRLADPAKLGLSPKGARAAFEQGRALAQRGLVPTQIICGIDQRNVDGARFTAAGIEDVAGKTVPYVTSPAVTYPHYTSAAQLAAAIAEHGDFIVHRYLCDSGDVAGLWTESAAGFVGRVTGAVTDRYFSGTPVLFDLNFEQMVVLHYQFISKEPIGPKGWIPTKGGGIVFSFRGMGGHCMAAAEFTPDLVLVPDSLSVRD